MVCVGTGGALGGVWRSPPLALSEFSTHPAESLNPHSLEGLTAMLCPGDPAHGCLAAAVRAQALRAAALEISVRHNGVLLDGIVRKLDRRRRVLMWRRAAMEGGTDGKVGLGGGFGARGCEWIWIWRHSRAGTGPMAAAVAAPAGARPAYFRVVYSALTGSRSQATTVQALG